MRGFAEWLDTHAWSTALHESLYMYPLIETTHVLSLTLFAGTIFIVDLRLLGVSFKTLTVSEVTSRVLPWTVVGFVVIVSTGLLLFYAIPIRTYHSVWFRIKVTFLIIAAINAWYFHSKVQRDHYSWDHLRTPPPKVRAAGAVSVLSWLVVIFCGRMIAYNWFDCDRPQPDWVIALAGCIEEA